MQIIISLAVGLASGFLAYNMKKKTPTYFLRNFSLGILGSMTGAFIFSLLGINDFYFVGIISFTGITSLLLILFVELTTSM
jgi:uncharacterized membrane protein YeaQ/YmgE (transglycosylase-associated protein family)